ncbi:MAG: PAS domain S-box protein [Deltaproteobacteria bacterium]|nr:PAS domain S-box protein [Deltaproteobacteria bacterium]
MNSIYLIDIVAFLATIATLFVLWLGREKVLHRDAWWLLLGLIGLTFFHHLSNVLEWSGITDTLDRFEDYFELLIPIMWFIFVFAVLREQSASALQESEERFKAIYDRSTHMVYLHDFEGNMIDANMMALNKLGYSRRDIGLLNFGDLLKDPDQIAVALESINEIMGKGYDKEPKEFELITKDGKSLWVKARGSILYENKKPKAIIGTAEDVTRQKKAEEELQKLALVIKYSSELVNLATMDGKMIFLNLAGSEMLGISPDEVERFHIMEIIPDNLKELVQDKVLGALAQGNTWEGDLQYRNIKTGALTDVHAMTFTVQEPNTAKPLFLANVSVDITKRKKVEKALQENEEKFRTLFDHAGDAIFIRDFKGQYLEVNNVACERYGYSREELLRMTSMDLAAPEYAEKVADNTKNIINKSHYIFESVHVCKDGKLISVELSSNVVKYNQQSAIMTTARDLTERKHLEAQIRQALKMEAIGTLAGGIAHDFNNLLMAITGYNSLMRLNTDTSHPHYKHLTEVEKCVESASELTRQLLGFARGGKYEVKPTDLNEFIKDHNRMFSRTKKEVAVHNKYKKNLWTTEVDRGQIGQVLMNIYVNAWQAMPDGGELHIQTENVNIDKDYIKPFEVEPGKFVKISITDTGIGMVEETKNQIFDPFFTTKEKERGTGMGLSSAYGIIKNHGGFITVYSELDKGSTFNVFLPASEKKKAEKDKKTAKKMKRGSGTILLIDDEQMMLDVGEEMLKGLGYDVLIAKGGNEGLEIYRENQRKIDMVILDMIMPGTTGSNAYDSLKEINNDIRVLLSSGYSINGKANDILERGCDGFIQKPFTLEQLSHKISEILNKE